MVYEVSHFFKLQITQKLFFLNQAAAVLLLLNAARRFPHTARLWSEFELHRRRAAIATSGDDYSITKKINPGMGSAALVVILVVSAAIQVSQSQYFLNCL